VLSNGHSTNYAETLEFFLNQNNPANFQSVWEATVLRLRGHATRAPWSRPVAARTGGARVLTYAARSERRVKTAMSCRTLAQVGRATRVSSDEVVRPPMIAQAMVSM